MSKSEKYQNILLAALGTTPQIITESLYHLMVIKQISIHEIHLITTSTGEENAEKSLFNDGAGPFYTFCKDYGFSSTEIVKRYHVITDTNGAELSDIRTPEDNEAAADFFLTTTKELTNRESTRIFATIAGGRKTMSAYLYLVMQLLGRQQDMLYHVLVQPESIESNPKFYYPKKDVAAMEFFDRDKNPFVVPVSEIKIEMAEIPFVRLGNIIDEEMMKSMKHFSELVELTQEELDKAQFEPEVTLDLPSRKLVCKTRRGDSVEVKLRPIEMTIYVYLAKNGALTNNPNAVKTAAPRLLKIYMDEYAIEGVNTASFNTAALQQHRSKINKKIRTALHSPLLIDFIQIHSDKSYRSPKYFLKLSPQKFRIITSTTLR